MTISDPPSRRTVDLPEDVRHPPLNLDEEIALMDWRRTTELADYLGERKKAELLIRQTVALEQIAIALLRYTASDR
jgi:hypothetical protein